MLKNLLRRTPAPTPRTEERLSFNQYADYFRFDGNRYLFPSSSMASLTASQGAKNAIVMACISVRSLVFSEVRFSYQRWSAGRPGELYGTPALRLLEQPWPAAHTGDLLARMELDASLYGNSYWVRVGEELVRLDPANVQVLTADVEDVVTGKPYGRRLVGYVYMTNQTEVAMWTPDEVAHYRPLPDPEHPYRGVSWLNAVLPDVMADVEMTTFKHSFLRNAATPNMVVQFQPGITKEQIEAFRELMDQRHVGADKAFSTLYLGAGADIKTVGSNLEQLSFKATQGAGETRIAAAAGVPASIVGISEGLAGSALNAGNYSAARRRFADGTVRPLWRSACGALSVLVPPPDGGSRLWFDDRDVSFLQEDVLDAANIVQAQAITMRQLVDGGYDPASVTQAVTTGDLSLLTHSGRLSVQLQTPGTQPAS